MRAPGVDEETTKTASARFEYPKSVATLYWARESGPRLTVFVAMTDPLIETSWTITVAVDSVAFASIRFVLKNVSCLTPRMDLGTLPISSSVERTGTLWP